MPRRPKPTKAEKLNRDIDRWQGKQEGAVIMLRKSAEMLAKLHRQRRRMLASAQIPRPAAVPAAYPTVHSESTLGAIDRETVPDLPAFLDQNAKDTPAVEPTPTKPKRQRAKPGPRPKSQTLGEEAAQVATALIMGDDRKARMAAAGFRKVTRD